ncbi:hypothetical protein TMES_04085 [Thalassospira mesophila]|uniref:Uncharacterized protein n=1 Tax=Thalassospira mesophila TaxID=1293891 RepID=A0A1Y2L6Q9_9PROT|nr:hypothetical protein TMES_04085 [Thalassospira mesophila]
MVVGRRGDWAGIGQLVFLAPTLRLRPPCATCHLPPATCHPFDGPAKWIVWRGFAGTGICVFAGGVKTP